jgi:hypothetical protein
MATMTFTLAITAAALALAVAMPAAGQDEGPQAKAPTIFVTGVMVTLPSNNVVPTLNTYPGANIRTWSDGWSQAVLTGGDSYEYCVSVASATASGTGSIAYKIVRGKTVIQTATVIDSFPVGSDGIWYYCAGYQQLPKSPGAANVVATFTNKPSSGSPEKASLSIKVLLK